MRQILLLAIWLTSLNYEVTSLNLPGPQVYVVTPSPKMQQVDKGRSVPFYYRNWIRRMDSPWNNTSTTTTTEKTKTPDLIFAEFESGNKNMKSIRKLLENEKIDTTTPTTTTARPIYVPDVDTEDSALDYGLPVTTTEKPKKIDMTDYFALYNNLYNTGPLLSPVYVPPNRSPSEAATVVPATSLTTMHTPLNNVKNIWNIIDSEKSDQNKWKEEPVSSEQPDITNKYKESQDNGVTPNENGTEDDGAIDENFAIPGFGTNPGNGAENESRAIRTEPNFRFPYVNLKPFQMKSSKKPAINSFSSSNKGQNMFTSLDSFHDLKNPVRGEAQDVVPMREPIDRYNPAQPYLPQQVYGSKSKQSTPYSPPPSPQLPSPQSAPVRAVANLVPPPPPPAPPITADDFPSPNSYDSFPPYAPAGPPPSSKPSSVPVSMLQPPDVSGPVSADDSVSDTSSDDSDTPIMGLGYRYKPPSPSVSQFFPTVPPTSKPFSGYSYAKPSIPDVTPPPMMDMGGNSDFHGYHYDKPEPSAPTPEHPLVSYGDHAPSHDHLPYGHHDAPPPSYHPDPDYPELIFDKPHGGGMKGESGMKDTIGMKPPPPPEPDMKPDMGAPTGPDDSGFPHDFPGDFKFHHDFDDHDYHHHHHHTTTTTTTTEMPRVNRYSYYYLGKKLYYLPLYFSVYFIIYVGALIIKAVLRHKITYPNSWKPNDTTASFFSKRSIESHLTNENLHEITGRVTRAIASAAEKYIEEKNK